MDLEGRRMNITYSKKYKKYDGQLRKQGCKAIWVGYFDTREEAEIACQKVLQGAPIEEVKINRKLGKSGIKGVYYHNGYYRVQCEDADSGVPFIRVTKDLEEAKTLKELSNKGELRKLDSKMGNKSGIEGVRYFDRENCWCVVCKDGITNESFFVTASTLEKAKQIRLLSDAGEMRKGVHKPSNKSGLAGVVKDSATGRWTVRCHNSLTGENFWRSVDTLEEAEKLRILSIDGQLTKLPRSRNNQPRRHVTYLKVSGRYGAEIRQGSKRISWIGEYDTRKEAESACARVLAGTPVSEVKPPRRNARKNKNLTT